MYWWVMTRLLSLRRQYREKETHTDFTAAAIFVEYF
jgi:hypothetical protein